MAQKRGADCSPHAEPESKIAKQAIQIAELARQVDELARQVDELKAKLGNAKARLEKAEERNEKLCSSLQRATQCNDRTDLPPGWLGTLGYLWHNQRKEFPLLNNTEFLRAMVRNIENNLKNPNRATRSRGMVDVEEKVQMYEKTEKWAARGGVVLRSEAEREAWVDTGFFFTALFPGTTVIAQPRIIVREHPNPNQPNPMCM